MAGHVPIHRLLVIAAMTAAWTIPSTATAQPTKANNGTELLFLGTAGGPPLRRDRSEPSTLIMVDGRSYLIDCGIGTMQRMLKAQIDPTQIKTIFLTHLHSDHDLGLADVMADDFFLLNLRGSAEFDWDLWTAANPRARRGSLSFRDGRDPAVCRESEAYRSVDRGQFLSPFKVNEIDRAGLVFQDDKIRVTAAENSHYALMSAPEQSLVQIILLSH